MKFTNTTSYGNRFLRRMLSFCCRELGFPIKLLRGANFCNRTYGTGVNGRAWLDEFRILIRIGPNTHYPRDRIGHRGVDLHYVDQLSAIVYVTGHEIQHLVNVQKGINDLLVANRDMEPHCVRMGKKCLLAFEANRECLLADWNRIPERMAASAPAIEVFNDATHEIIDEPSDLPAITQSLVARRAAKVVSDLARWERKLKLAKTKVKKLKRKAAYYAKRRKVT